MGFVHAGIPAEMVSPIDTDRLGKPQ